MSSEKRIKVLFFAPWYPSRLDAMSGLFVRKHALAVSAFCHVCALYVVADEHVSHFEVVEQDCNGFHEVYVYFPFVDRPVLRQLTKAVNFVRSFALGYRAVLGSFGRPDVTQTNVLTRCGVLSWFLSVRHSIPYVIIEHWSRYMFPDRGYHGLLRKWVTKFVARRASALLAVSDILRSGMKNCGIVNEHFGLVNNVVEDFFFRPHMGSGSPVFHFLHVSTFDEMAKNVCGMLRAFAVASRKCSVRLTLVGTGPDVLMAKAEADRLGLQGLVEFVGEKKPQEVADYMCASDAMLMFSHYETASVVASEALASGLPIVSSRVGILPMVVNDDCGVLVSPGDEEALANAIVSVASHPGRFSEEALHRQAEAFRFDAVGRYLAHIYADAIAARQSSNR